MMTNGEHDMLWKEGAQSIPGIKKTLNVANAIAIAKELYEISDKTDEDKQGYKKTLLKLLRDSGYECN